MADQIVLIGAVPIRVVSNGDGTYSAYAIDKDAGVKATAVTIPDGGVGKLGWLSGIYDRLSKVVLAAGTAVIGKVGIDQAIDGTTNRVVSKISQASGENVISFGATAQPVTVTESSANGMVSVTPNDTVDLAIAPTKGLYVGVSGNIAVIMADDTEVTIVALAEGMIHPISVKRVKSTGTTATSILAVY